MPVRLEQCAEVAVGRVGAKARGLAEALRAGFPVPPGVVVVPEDDARDTGGVVEALGTGPFAVRSSSPHEDGSATSWAGQFLTRLWVEPADLSEAIEEVRRSGDGAAARAYGGAGAQAGGDGEAGARGAIPVLVQPIVEAQAAGVAFTIDPRDGRDDRCVVEAVAGLGESLADGRATPARFVADALSGDLVEAAASTSVPIGEREVCQVVEMALRASEWRGEPLDVEWAWALGQAWLLQARPVTAATWSPAPGQWTSANFREVMPGVVTPLTASMSLEYDFPHVISLFTQEMGMAASGELVTEGRRFYARPYWRVDTVKEHLTRLPGFRERDFDRTIGIAPTYEGDGLTSTFSPGTPFRIAKALRGLARAYRDDGPAAGRYRDGFAAEEARWLAIDWDALGDEELAALVRESVEQHWRTNSHAMRVSILSQQAQDDLRPLLAKLAPRLDHAPNEGLLLSGLGELATGRAAREMAGLAERVAGRREAVVAAAAPADLPPEVRILFEDLVERSGYLAEADEELSQPRWDEDASLPLALFKAAVSAAGVQARDGTPAGDGTPARDGASAGDRSGAGEEERIARAAGWRVRGLRRKVARARRYAWWREEIRDVLTRTNRLTRRAFLAQGRRWAAAGVLGEPDDVFWLTAPEVVAALERGAGDASLAGLVGQRRRHAARFRNWRPPDALGAAVAPPPVIDGDSVIHGTACSAGVAEGPVAVLRSLDDAPKVEPGSILVLEYSNPGWTPVYTVAAGLVTEEGGLLSHGSIVARERGLPAVIQVPGATRRLRDGQMVRVDGDRGTVSVLDSDEAAPV